MDRVAWERLSAVLLSVDCSDKVIVNYLNLLDSQGTYQQIITFGRDEDTKTVKADSFLSFWLST